MDENMTTTASQQEIINEKKVGQESLLPQEERIMDNISYTLAWVGTCVFIGYFMLGASLVPPVGKLNLLQAFVCMALSAVIVSVCFNINGQAGHKYGIPFVIQARPAFGIKGSKLPSVIRAVPAIMWYGVQTWVGALALNGISEKLIGFDSPMFWFVAFQVLQIVLSILGFQGIKWLENVGAIIIVASLAYMFYAIYTNYGSLIEDKIINIPGTWGLAFWGGTVAFIGVYTTLMLNIGDYTRELSKKTSNKTMLALHIIATVPTTTFMALIGLLAAGVTGTWDPINLFVELMPNSFVLILSLFFIALAQITTNVMANVVPPTYVMMDLFGISWKQGAFITGCLGFLTFPWKIATANGFFLFIQIYSIFLGPIFAVLVVDYYFIRKKKYNMTKLYDKQGEYKNVNWAGMIAVAIGAAFGMIVVELSWYISLVPAGLSYYLLMKYVMKKNNLFAPDEA